GGETSRIYRTTNGGDDWTILTNGLPVVPSQKGRISIDISKSNPNVLYAMYADAIGNVQGVYKTIDGGDTWTEVNSSQLINVGFHWWFEGIFVDPADENSIYYLGLNVQKSTDGGLSWFNSFPNAHVDQHALAFNPSIPNQVLLGNDGGFYKSSNQGVTSAKDVSLPITQFYRFHVDFQNSNKIYGGSQDNSTMRTTTGGLNDWEIITGGDGFQPLVDPTNTNIIYALSQYGNLIKSVNNGTSFFGATSGISGADRKNWDTPIVFDPTNPQVLYYGANRLYKTSDAAANWIPLSPDLSNGPHPGNLVFGTIVSISVSPLDNQKIVVGTDDGNVWITQNGGANWIKVSDNLPNRWVTKVLTDRNDVNSFYVTFSGYRYGENIGHVYKTSDNGTTWENRSGNLPDVPVNSITKDVYGNLFLATDIGVLASADEGVIWDLLGDNLPSVVVTDLHIHEPTEILYAATYGRSTYKIEISEDILTALSQNLEFNVDFFPNPTRGNLKVNLDRKYQNIQVLTYDNLGRSVKTEYFKNTQRLNLDLRGLPKTTYFIKVVADQKETTKKVVVY
ncbi:T9SS type A sorting domain-containing protein, partial [uncultured Planktosalinus sp.]|uniref:T9SS type A sorting domain-containing protein n=1 Tax=uncultured Planktosalinus sp. TaxID=1810935 RepID=UPI0030D85304